MPGVRAEHSGAVPITVGIAAASCEHLSVRSTGYPASRAIDKRDIGGSFDRGPAFLRVALRGGGLLRLAYGYRFEAATSKSQRFCASLSAWLSVPMSLGSSARASASNRSSASSKEAVAGRPRKERA